MIGGLVSEVGESLRGVAFILADVSEVIVVLAVGSFNKRLDSTTVNKSK